MRFTDEDIAFFQNEVAEILKQPERLLLLIRKVQADYPTDKLGVDLYLFILISHLNQYETQLKALVDAPDTKRDDEAYHLIEAIQMCLMQLSEVRVDARYSQQEYFGRMKAAGYFLGTEEGHCFGFSHMAMQAFLAQDMEALTKRLLFMMLTPVEDFADNFAPLKEKVSGLFSEGKIEQANQLNQTIVDIRAFFDGLALYQSTALYDELFETRPTKSQDEAKAMALVCPTSLDTDENRPVLMRCHTGSYDLNELIAYIELMQEQLGENSFALILIASRHAINLNYDAKTKHWILIDPNHLPGFAFKILNC